MVVITNGVAIVLKHVLTCPVTRQSLTILYDAGAKTICAPTNAHALHPCFLFSAPPQCNNTKTIAAAKTRPALAREDAPREAMQ